MLVQQALYCLSHLPSPISFLTMRKCASEVGISVISITIGILLNMDTKSLPVDSLPFSFSVMLVKR